MSRRHSYDAIVVGAGPNGLAAAITLARAGRSVLVLEAKETIGGGSRSMELTLPGFIHDVCSAIHPMGVASPFFRSLPLEQHGLQWIHPSAPLAHPFDDGTAALLERPIEATGATLGRDAEAYHKLMAPLVSHWDILADAFLGPLRPQSMRHPFVVARFGLKAIRPARYLAQSVFKEEPARALFAGISAHSLLPLERSPSSGFGLILGILGHVVGWPMPLGGSQKIVDALASYLCSLGGEIVTGVEVKSIDALPSARAVLWKALECARAGTVHLGGTLAEIAAAEKAVWRGQHPENPFVLVAQQSLFDPTRAPEGKHTLWTYCHLPNGSTFDMTERIESQIERFAPGFRDRVLARHVANPRDLERYDANYIGGDINGGVEDLWQFFTRPTLRLVPYSTPAKGIYICSSSTPPGGGVHGMCGYFAAQAALHEVLSP